LRINGVVEIHSNVIGVENESNTIDIPALLAGIATHSKSDGPRVSGAARHGRMTTKRSPTLPNIGAWASRTTKSGARIRVVRKDIDRVW
jgi:hypothetical protein